MIGLRGWASRRECAPARVWLLLGLVVLVTAHLAGTVHCSAFAGPHVGGIVDCSQLDPLDTDDDHDRPARPPGHEHTADGHGDHMVDRPRAVCDDAIAEPEHDVPSPVPVTAASGPLARPGIRCGAGGIARAPDGPSILTLNCVRRL
ncbi:MAG: hypothetical protein LBV60_11635 [Streptomyces sp.]|nr:hypothetical protein [Streptomyces sp.]